MRRLTVWVVVAVVVALLILAMIHVNVPFLGGY